MNEDDKTDKNVWWYLVKLLWMMNEIIFWKCFLPYGFTVAYKNTVKPFLTVPTITTFKNKSILHAVACIFRLKKNRKSWLTLSLKFAAKKAVTASLSIGITPRPL